MTLIQPLTDSQWQVIAPLLPTQRKRRHCLRLIVDALRYICRTGCQWRCLPSSFPPWSAVYYYLRRWQLSGLWQTLTDAVNQADQVAAGRPATPSLSCLDSHSVRLAPRIFEHRRLDGGKHVNGCKRQIITDVGGRILAYRVHAANGHDELEAQQLLPARPVWGARLVTVVTDKGYLGRFARQMAKLGLTHQIGSRSPSARSFLSVAKRWVVARTFAWLTSFSHLAIDYEFTPRSHET